MANRGKSVPVGEMETSGSRLKARLNELVEESNKLLNSAIDEQRESNQGHTGLVIDPLDYQSWYTECIRFISQVAPERLDEFCAQYDRSKATSKDSSSIEKFGISDYLQFFSVKDQFGDKVFDDREVAIIRLMTQVAILKSMSRRLDSVLADIRGVLQADLFDSELGAARHLCENGHIRAAGAVAGVVLESHLQMVCVNHSVTYRKRKPTINDLLRYLRENGVIDIPVERRVQALADIRNLCDHKRHRDPTLDEVEQLIDGVDNTIKTLH